MKKQFVIPAACLALLLLAAGCSAPGSSAADATPSVTPASGTVSLAQAKLANAAMRLASSMATKIQMGLVTSVDNGTVGVDLKRKSADGTVFAEQNPSPMTFPRTMSLTFQGYTDTTTGYRVSGTIVTTITSAGGNQTSTTNISLTHAVEPVRTVTGTLTTVNFMVSGSWSYNGVLYSRDLMVVY
jgi:hypothetical protein